jgi:hypothetical protein
MFKRKRAAGDNFLRIEDMAIHAIKWRSTSSVINASSGLDGRHPQSITPHFTIFVLAPASFAIIGHMGEADICPKGLLEIQAL